jgi:adenosylcobinamide-GDP ribazoletransferase
LKKFLFALNFLTLIPFKNKEEVKKETIVSAVTYFPFVGVGLGIALTGIYFCFRCFFPFFLTGFLVILGEIVLTGGLHLDGLADFVDGVVGGKNKKEILKIMEEPTIGSFGTLALIIILGLKYISFCTLIHQEKFPFLLTLMPMVGRTAIVYLSFFSPPAKKEGLGFLFTQYQDGKGFTLALTAILSAQWYFFKIKGILVLAFLFLILEGIRRLSLRKIKGITGDVLGAAVEVIEVSYLLVQMLFLPES